VALLRAQGLDRDDKLAMARFSTTARWMGWRLDTDCSVAELLERYDQTDRLIRLMWRPLCLAALNTPPERASANVFLAVLRDSLGAKRAASDMLIPRHDLTALLPDAAAGWLAQRGAQVRLGRRVQELAQVDGGWSVTADDAAERFDAVVLATPATATRHLIAALPGMEATVAMLDALTYEPITTCYLQYAARTRLAQPLHALEDDPEAGRWGQFVFDRGQLDAAQAGLFAVVVSASGDAAALPQEALAEAVAAQLAEAFARPDLAVPSWSRVVTEKRATYACTPALARPANATALPGLALAGDYTAGDYPATLEMAVRSGLAAARLVETSGRRR
jgi:squalene-associated FAD-dependent desaturase